MSVGRTKPILLACERSDGSEVEVITKFSSGCDRGVTGLAIESLLAMLAADLRLPVPEPLLVHVDPEVIDRDISPSARALADSSTDPSFGSIRLPAAFIAVSSDKRLDNLIDQAAEVFAFDGMVLNPDRLVKNPNCQSDGTKLAIFDHEAALAGLDVLGTMLQPYPWVTGGLLTLGTGPGQHVLFALLRGKEVQLDRFAAAWTGVTDVRLQAYKDALPDTWAPAFPVIDQALNYLRELRDHVPAVLDEVRRVLS